MAPVCPRDGDCGATGKGGACTGYRWEGADLAAPGSVWREAGRQAAAHHGRHVPYLQERRRREAALVTWSARESQD